MPLTKREIVAFVAGLFEGEGSISVCNLSAKSWNKRTDYSLKIRISNTNKHLLEWIVLYYGKGHVYRSSKINNKTLWAWQTSDKQAEEFLGDMMPYLIEKRSRALLALKFRETKDNGHHRYYRIPDEISAKRQAIYEQMKSLNEKGGKRDAS